MAVFVLRKDLPVQDVGHGVQLRVLGATERMNALHWLSPDGASLPVHSHPEEQFGYVLRGGFRMTIGEETRELSAGDSYFIPANEPHSFLTIGVTEAIDIFSPPRLAAIPKTGG